MSSIKDLDLLFEVFRLADKVSLGDQKREGLIFRFDYYYNLIDGSECTGEGAGHKGLVLPAPHHACLKEIK